MKSETHIVRPLALFFVEAITVHATSINAGAPYSNNLHLHQGREMGGYGDPTVSLACRSQCRLLSLHDVLLASSPDEITGPKWLIL